MTPGLLDQVRASLGDGEHESAPFCDSRHQTLYECLLEFKACNRPIDLVTLPQALRELNKLDAAGGSAYIMQLAGDSLPPENLPLWLDDLNGDWTCRKLLAELDEARRGIEVGGKPAEVAVERLKIQLDKCGTTEAFKTSWHSLIDDGAAIMAEELPPVVEILQGIVAEQSKLVIASGAKSFKTWVTIDLGLSISHGEEFWGRRTTRKRVLYVNLELKPKTFKRRVQSIAKAKTLLVEPGWFSHLPLRGQLAGIAATNGFLVRSLVTKIIEIAKLQKAEVVIVDPTYKMNLDGDENSAQDQTRFFNELDRITTEAGCTLILNDHFGKGNQAEKDPLDTIRGSSAKGGDVDAAIVLRRHEEHQAFCVDIVHRELPPVEPFVLSWKYPLMELRPDLDPEAMKKPKTGPKKKHEPEALIAAIAETTPENAVSVTEWAKRLDISRPTLVGYLPSLRAKQWIATTGEGNKARQYLTDAGRKAANRNLIEAEK